MYGGLTYTNGTMDMNVRGMVTNVGSSPIAVELAALLYDKDGNVIGSGGKAWKGTLEPAQPTVFTITKVEIVVAVDFIKKVEIKLVNVSR